MSNDLPVINMQSQHERWNDLRRGKVRAAVIVAGDSNANFSTDGYHDGLERAAYTAVGSGGPGLLPFATPLMGFGGAGNVGVGSMGGDIQAAAETESLAGLDANLNGFVPSATHMTHMQPYFRANNVTDGDGRGYQLLANNALGNNALLRAHYWHGVGPSYGGSLQVGFRVDESPFTQHVSATVNLSGAAAWGLVRNTVDLPAGTAAADKLLLAELYRPGQAQTAPVFCPFMMTERVDRAAGLMVTPLVFAPSQHLGTIEAVYRSNCPDAWKRAHMRAISDRVGVNGFMVWYVTSGINDHSASRTAATFVADFDRFRAEVLRVSDLEGIGRERHLFIAAPTHPQNSASPDATLRGYIHALSVYAPTVPNVLVINQHSTAFGDAAAWTARHDGGGAAHLKNTTAGYTSACLVMWSRLFAAAEACRVRGVAVKAVGSGVV